MVTISTHNGSQVHQAHNIRNEKVVAKENHIDPDGIHETWVHEPVREAYHRLFDEAVEKYNAKQTREDRKIGNYYNKVQENVKQHPAYEMIIGVYGNDCPEDLGKVIMQEFVDGWKERNPNLELIGAYYHADEQGEPHVHLDYVPVAHGYTKGMETQAGLVKAYEEMGFTKQGNRTAQIQWEARENKVLTEICQHYGLEVSHPRQEGIQHLETELYKSQKALETALDHTKGLLDLQDDIRAKTGELEAIRDKAEKQAEKGIERKRKAFSKSWKKDKESGWSYDKGLEKEIRTLVEDRAEDVKAISHTDLDVQRQYDNAERVRRQNESLRKQLQEDKEHYEALVNERANIEAQKRFREFLQKEFSKETQGRGKRLEDFCKGLTFTDGTNALERFEAKEKERQEKLEKAWDRGWSR